MEKKESRLQEDKMIKAVCCRCREKATAYLRGNPYCDRCLLEIHSTATINMHQQAKIGMRDKR